MSSTPGKQKPTVGKRSLFMLLWSLVTIAFFSLGSNEFFINSNGEIKQPALPGCDDLRQFLLGPDEYGGKGTCPPGCGCRSTLMDCPSWYSFFALEASAAVQDPAVLSAHHQILSESRFKAKKFCHNVSTAVQNTGGWCLVPRTDDRRATIRHPNGISYPLADHHVPCSTRIVKELIFEFSRENTTSVNDFGAGIAQYKAAITSALPHIEYRAYDGAGNGEEYTSGMMQYADLTIPLDLPVADWVISLEVGEHIPSKYEGMLLRNIHRHNSKGVILSWAVLGQKGHSHINDHSNEYIVRTFVGMGYIHDIELSNRLRNGTDNYMWFTKSIMVFRKVSRT
mmetsp:Transcript_1728/g.3791  ORF Transcript_1728/g.3791 Transcript_1728/m.3791 type:complete len:339 (-) Transcript_1728:4749-5765(-)